MEVKVYVDGVPRVVCGVTEHTTCQEVVIALAQALGRPGRYTLKEKFKDFERCVSSGERLLESLQKYGEHGKEVQLTLLLNPRPALPWDPAPGGRTADLRDPPAPPLRRRRPDPGTRTRKGSATLAVSTHRQSLPVLSRPRQEEEAPLEEVKRPKRKSLTLLDAWGWLGSLGRGRLHYSVRDQDRNQKTEKKNYGDIPKGCLGSGPESSVSVSSKEDWGQEGFLSCVRRRKRERQCRERRASCCSGTQNPEEDGQHFRKLSVGSNGAVRSPDQTLGGQDPNLGSKDRALGTKDQALGSKSEATRTARSEEEKVLLRQRIMSQGCRLRDLHLQMTSVDHQIHELEVQQMESQARLDAQRTSTEEETKEVLFWEKELGKELGFERDIQAQFLEMREKARECRAELEEYCDKMQLLALTAGAKTLIQETAEEEEEDPGILGKGVTEISTAVEKSDGSDCVNTGRKETPSQPHASVPGHQIKERRLTGPTELREWWKRWSETHSQGVEPQPPVHRSELTIYLGSARV